MSAHQTHRFDVAGTLVTISHRLEGARLELVIERSGETRELVAQVARPTMLRVRSSEPCRPAPGMNATVTPGWWPVGARFGWGGSFEQLATFAERPSCEWNGDDYSDEPGPAPFPVPVRDPAAARCRALLRAVARAVHERLDPDALRVARRFRPAQRWWYYAAALDDPSGRVGQLASTCPGALVLAREHASAFEWCGLAEHDLAARRILGDAAAGLALRRLVSRAVDGWAGVPPTDPSGPLARALATTPAPERAALLARQRLLVRRAGPWVRCADLARPALVAFAPEDIPRSTIENRRWFFASALAADALAHGPDGPRDALSRLVSTSALRLYGWAHRAVQRFHASHAEAVFAPMFRLSTYCGATGRRPTRRSDLVALLEASERWHDRTEAAGRLERLLARIQALKLGPVTSIRALRDPAFLWSVSGLPFPPPPFAPPEPGLAIEPIRSRAELEREGRRMEHCAATLLPRVVSGELVVYSVRCGTAPYTLAVAPQRDGTFRVDELRGPSDVRVPLEVWRRVVRWVERLGPASPAGAPPLS